MPNQNLKGDILEATIQAFQKKGLKFTMDDLASLLGISKKTIYTVFPDKNSLVLEMVDYCFSSIKESEQKVLQDLSLDTVGKIRAILGVLPEGYRELDLRQLYQLKERYPEVYEKVKSRLETGWESTISLLEQGITEGKIRNIQIPILKTMMEATLEQFFQRDVLVQNGISYHEALDEVVSILIDGITETKRKRKVCLWNRGCWQRHGLYAVSILCSLLLSGHHGRQCCGNGCDPVYRPDF